MIVALIVPSRVLLHRLRGDDRCHCYRHHHHSCRITDHPEDVQQVGLHSWVTWQYPSSEVSCHGTFLSFFLFLNCFHQLFPADQSLCSVRVVASVVSQKCVLKLHRIIFFWRCYTIFGIWGELCLLLPKPGWGQNWLHANSVFKKNTSKCKCKMKLAKKRVTKGLFGSSL